MIALYFGPFGVLLSGAIDSFWIMMLLWIAMGFGMSGIGLSIMHDANHGAYSRKKYVNNILGYLINFLGAYHLNWKIQHNVLHHSFTNVDGHDEDISNKSGILRLTPNQERKKIVKYQAIYAPFLYCIMTLYWLISKDFGQLARYQKENLLSKQGKIFSLCMTEVVFNKIGYVVLTIVLPLIIISLPWWQVVIGFMTMQFICGLTLALIFQPAHVIEETDFYVPKADGSIENNWAIHQMRTTANFAGNSTFFTWFIGGLNFQIEHHLFPNICHVHYPKIAPIVKATALEYNVPYYQHKTFIGAIKSHFSLLHSLGTGEYDKKLATATA